MNTLFNSPYTLYPFKRAKWTNTTTMPTTKSIISNFTVWQTLNSIDSSHAPPWRLTLHIAQSDHSRNIHRQIVLSSSSAAIKSKWYNYRYSFAESPNTRNTQRVDDTIINKIQKRKQIQVPRIHLNIYIFIYMYISSPPDKILLHTARLPLSWLSSMLHMSVASRLFPLLKELIK